MIPLFSLQSESLLLQYVDYNIGMIETMWHHRRTSWNNRTSVERASKTVGFQEIVLFQTYIYLHDLNRSYFETPISLYMFCIFVI